jgi:TolB protein
MVFLMLSVGRVSAQDDFIRTGTGIGMERTRIAVSSFQPAADTATLMRVFDATLWNDLEFSGVMEMVSRSFYPLTVPSRPAAVKLEEWRDPPVGAHMLVVGNASMAGDRIVVEGWLMDPRNAAEPTVLGRRYVEAATERQIRTVAHKFANEIIFRLGGGVLGIAETKIAFVRRMSPRVKEIFVMDYDGANQDQITRLDSLSLTPAISVDGERIAFTTYHRDNPDIMVYSLLTKGPLSFFNRKGLNTTPTWSPDGTRLAFTSSVTGDPEIYIGDPQGREQKRLTVARGVDISPAWNPRTGAQIAFVSDRNGRPQIYMMDSDGANVTQIVSGGTQALDPAWSPNGRLLAFTWDAAGAYDIWIMDVATQQMVQLTKDMGSRNENPTWSPDNRHIVFESNRSGTKQIWSMLADGTRPRQLTFQGENTEPAWSSK